MSKTMQIPLRSSIQQRPSQQRSSQQHRLSSGLRRVLSALALCVAVAGFGNSAMADEAKCTVIEIKATSGDGGIDAELKPITNKLKKPPFSAWKTFKVLKKHSVKAAQMKAVSVSLADGGKLGLLYKERNDAKGSKTRLRIGFTLDNKVGKRKADITLKVDSGDYTLIGQDADKDGSSRLLAISCAIK